MSQLVASTTKSLPVVDGVRYLASWTSPAGLVLESTDTPGAVCSAVPDAGVTARLSGSRGATSWIPRRSVDGWSLQLDGSPVSVAVVSAGFLRTAAFRLVCRHQSWLVSPGGPGAGGQWLRRDGESTPVATAGTVLAGWLRFRSDVSAAEAALAVLLRTRLMAATTRLYFVNHLT